MIDHVYQRLLNIQQKSLYTRQRTTHEAWHVKHACLMLHAEVPPGGSFLVLAIPNRAAHGDGVLEK